MWIISLIPDSILYGFIWMMIIAGAIAYLATMFAFLMPLNKLWTPIVRLLSVAMMVGGVFLYGGYGVEMEWRKKAAELQAEMDRKVALSEQNSKQIVTKYVEKVKVVKEKGNVIVKEVPKYITKDADANCVVPKSFVLLHDSAAKNEVPDSTQGVDGTASGTKLSTIGETITINYNNYHQLSERLKALQDWVSSQERIYNGK